MSDSPAQATTECLKRKRPIKDSIYKLEILNPQFAPKVEKPQESEAAGHGAQDGRCPGEEPVALVPGGVGRLPGAPKPALPGLVYTNTQSSLGSFTAQSNRKRDTITTGQRQRVRYREIFFMILGIILGKKKLISEGSGTVLKSRKSRDIH